MHIAFPSVTFGARHTKGMGTEEAQISMVLTEPMTLPPQGITRAAWLLTFRPTRVSSGVSDAATSHVAVTPAIDASAAPHQNQMGGTIEGQAYTHQGRFHALDRVRRVHMHASHRVQSLFYLPAGLLPERIKHASMHLAPVLL
jgi:hypothetical protein